MEFVCMYCGKLCKNKNSKVQHEIRCKLNENHIICKPTYGYKGKVGWSKGLTKYTDDRLSNVSAGVNKYYETHNGTFKGKHHTVETKKRMSENAMVNNFQSHWGSRKSYEYKGITFISYYEVQVAEDLDKNEILWEKPKYGIFNYTDSFGKIHTYTPDFYLPDYDVYLDPKNDFLINNINPTLGYSDMEKINWVIQQNNVRIIILNKNQLSWEQIKSLL